LLNIDNKSFRFVIRNRDRNRYRTESNRRYDNSFCHEHRKPLQHESGLETDCLRLEVENRFFLSATHPRPLLQADGEARLQPDREPDGEGRSRFQGPRQIGRRCVDAQTEPGKGFEPVTQCDET